MRVTPNQVSPSRKAENAKENVVAVVLSNTIEMRITRASYGLQLDQVGAVRDVRSDSIDPFGAVGWNRRDSNRKWSTLRLLFPNKPRVSKC
jgi:hypothetical protein